MSDQLKTTVVNVRGKDRATLEADPDFVYVGRAVWRGGWKQSFWANPRRLRKDEDPTEAVGEYFERIAEALTVPDEPPSPRGRLTYFVWALGVKTLLPGLRGKKLGCWCCDWDGTGKPERPCHAVVLARFANALALEDPS
jgi:hypothetical protein